MAFLLLSLNILINFCVNKEETPILFFELVVLSEAVFSKDEECMERLQWYFLAVGFQFRVV